MDLGDARFGELKDFGDFLELEILNIIEDEHLGLGLGEAAQAGEEKFAVFLAQYFSGGVERALIGDNFLVEDGVGIVAAVGGLVEGEEGDGFDAIEEGLVFAVAELEVVLDFLGCGFASEKLREAFLDLGELAGIVVNGAGDPVEPPQFVEDGAADAQGAVGVEAGSFGRIVALDGVHESKDAGADQFFARNVGGKKDGESIYDLPDKGEKGLGQGFLSGNGRFRIFFDGLFRS